jgi:hypothetical protein
MEGGYLYISGRISYRSYSLFLSFWCVEYEYDTFA